MVSLSLVISPALETVTLTSSDLDLSNSQKASDNKGNIQEYLIGRGRKDLPLLT